MGKQIKEMLLFWGMWTLATGGGMAIFGMLDWVLTSPHQANTWIGFFLVNFYFLISQYYLLLIGLFQWLILRRWVPNTAWWVPASLAGSLVPPLTGWMDRTNPPVWMDLTSSYFTDVAPPGLILTMGIVALLAGFCQWLVIRRKVRLAWLWMPANALVLGAGWEYVATIGEILATHSSGSFSRDNLGLYLATSALSWSFVGACLGLLLAWLVVFGNQEKVPASPKITAPDLLSPKA